MLPAASAAGAPPCLATKSMGILGRGEEDGAAAQLPPLPRGSGVAQRLRSIRWAFVLNVLRQYCAVHRTSHVNMLARPSTSVPMLSTCWHKHGFCHTLQGCVSLKGFSAAHWSSVSGSTLPAAVNMAVMVELLCGAPPSHADCPACRRLVSRELDSGKEGSAPVQQAAVNAVVAARLRESRASNAGSLAAGDSTVGGSAGGGGGLRPAGHSSTHGSVKALLALVRSHVFSCPL